MIVPSKENGFKFEIFIFDSYPFAESFSLLEVERDEEFAPVKNAPGSSNCAPEHARAQISNLHRKWLENHGVKFEGKLIIFLVEDIIKIMDIVLNDKKL